MLSPARWTKASGRHRSRADELIAPVVVSHQISLPALPRTNGRTSKLSFSSADFSALPTRPCAPEISTLMAQWASVEQFRQGLRRSFRQSCRERLMRPKPWLLIAVSVALFPFSLLRLWQGGVLFCVVCFFAEDLVCLLLELARGRDPIFLVRLNKNCLTCRVSETQE